MANMDLIVRAESGVATAKADLANAIKATFVPGIEVLVKGPRGEKKTKVVNVEGEDLFLESSKGSFKRHYSVVKLA